MLCENVSYKSNEICFLKECLPRCTLSGQLLINLIGVSGNDKIENDFNFGDGEHAHGSQKKNYVKFNK